MPAQILDANRTVKSVLQIMNAEPSSAPNNSQQHLMNAEPTAAGLPLPPITGLQKITVVVLCFVNLINYMDRYTIAGNGPLDHLYDLHITHYRFLTDLIVYLSFDVTDRKYDSNFQLGHKQWRRILKFGVLAF